MKVSLQPVLSDTSLNATQSTSQRQLAIPISAIANDRRQNVPLNLCLILDQSGSMEGEPIEMVKQAASRLVDKLQPRDRLSVVGFTHRAKVIVPNQIIRDAKSIKRQIERLSAEGGTSLNEGLKLGIEELEKGKKAAISQAFLLTDGENEHGNNDRCLKLAELAASYNFTLSTLGFGDCWNQDVLEKIADAGGGALSYIQEPKQAAEEFSRLFERIQAVGLTNAHLLLSLVPKVRLAELKPVAQVAPDTIELPVKQDSYGRYTVRLGDVMQDVQRVVLANVYIGQLPKGRQTIASVQVQYDDPAINQSSLLSENIPIEVNVMQDYQSDADPHVQQYILALAKYRQTQLAEAKLLQGDRAGAATMLQTAAKTALQMGDRGAATVLQKSATRLQQGGELSEAERKKTRIVSKTVLQE